MFRKFIEKINSVIQWTKQWHFFHVLFVGSFVIALIPYIINILMLIFDFIFLIEQIITTILGRHSEIITDDHIVAGEIVIIFTFIITYILASIFTSILGLIVELSIFIKRRSSDKPLTVTSSFLTKNKIYNFIYYNAFITFFVFCILCFIMFL